MVGEGEAPNGGMVYGQGAGAMRCTVCGAELRTTKTDLPFKVRDSAIVIVKSLPVAQCVKCPEYLIDDAVLRCVDDILARVDSGAELEIIRYAA